MKSDPALEAAQARPYVKRMKVVQGLTCYNCRGMPEGRGVGPGAVKRVYREIRHGTFEISLGACDPEGKPVDMHGYLLLVITPPTDAYEIVPS